MTIEIAGRLIGAAQPPFVIAEMSGNHNQSLERALKIVEAAAQAGAHAIKLQTYTADTMTLNERGGNFEIKDKTHYGRAKIYTIYTNRPIRLGNGINLSWNMRTNWD